MCFQVANIHGAFERQHRLIFELGSLGARSNSSSILPTNCSRMSSTVITPAVEPNSSTTTAKMAAAQFEFGQQLGKNFRFRHNQHIVHDLADLHLGDASRNRLAEVDKRRRIQRIRSL